MRRHDRLQKKHFTDVLASITRARNMDVRALSSAEVDRRIGLIMDGYHTVVIKAQMSGLYRARKNIDDTPWQSIADLWYPPPSVVLNRGRFNEPGTSAFYACNRATGAIYEIHPQVGDMLTLLIVRSKEPFAELDCAHIGLERSLAPEVGFVPRDRMLRTNPRFQAMLRHYGISNKWLALDNFLSEMATTLFSPEEEQDKYKITNAIGRLLMRIPGAHGLNYPSVATNLVSLNLCLRPEIADQYFKPLEAWMIKIEERAEELPGLRSEKGPFYRTTFVRRSEMIEPNGRIEWSDVLQDVQPNQIAHLAYRTRLPADIQQEFMNKARKAG
jgi:hypothetical protein